MHIHTHTQRFTDTYAITHACMHSHNCTDTYLQTCTHNYAHTDKQTHSHTHTHAHTCIDTESLSLCHTHTHAHTHTCIDTHTTHMRMHTRTHACTYTKHAHTLSLSFSHFVTPSTFFIESEVSVNSAAGVAVHEMTLSAKRKISQRQKRSSPSHALEQSTQTEEVIRRTGSFRDGQGHREVSLVDGEFYEEQSLLYERLLKAEEVC